MKILVRSLRIVKDPNKELCKILVKILTRTLKDPRRNIEDPKGSL